MIHSTQGTLFASLAPAGHYLALRVGFAFPAFEFNALPDSWVAAYTEQGMMLDDPVMRWVYHNTGTIRWSDLTETDPRGMLDAAAQHGMPHGAAVSIEGAGDGLRSFGMFARDDRPFRDAELAQIERQLRELHVQSAPSNKLTAAEIEALTMVKEGMILKEIAFRLGVSEGAIKQRLKNARIKLNARTGSHAVSIAVASKLI